MKNPNKYRAFDYSTNIIVSAKVNGHNYVPYQSIKQHSESKSSKNIQPTYVTTYQPTNMSISAKLYERNKKISKVISKNDRNDLCLEGDNVFDHKRFNPTPKLNINAMLYAMNKLQSNEEEKNKTLENFFKERSYYKVGKQKNKCEIQQSTANTNKKIVFQVRNQSRTSSRQPTIKVSEKDETVMINSIANEARKQSRQSYRKSLVNFAPTQSDEFTKQKKSQKKKQLSIRQTKIKRQNLLKHKRAASNDNINKTQKAKRPLFYVEPKQIAHIKADSFIVTEYPSGKIILGNYFRKVNQIASLTKIMTFYTIIKVSEKFQKDISKEIIIIDVEAESMTGTSAQIITDDIYTVEQLLYGLMLPSGNDAAVALAKWAGSLLLENDKQCSSPTEKNLTPLKKFISEMNKICQELGLKNTKFANPHGLPNQMSGSSPEDMATLFGECLKYELFKTIIKTKEYRCWVEHKGTQHEVIWENTHKLLRRPNFLGGKTGVTITAGPCLASCYEAGSKIFIIVLLKTTKLSRRFKETRMILGLALSKLNNKEYRSNIRQIMRNDPELDSDNSEDEHEFCYNRTDAQEMAKRNKILANQM